MTQETIAAGFAGALLALVESKGIQAQTLLSQCDIDPPMLSKPDNRMPLRQFLNLMETGKALCDEPALALHYGEMQMVPETSIVYLICASADSVIEAFNQMNRYSRLVIDADDMQTEIRTDDVGTWLELNSPIYHDFPALVESGLARIICGSAAYFNDRPFAKLIHVSYPEPTYIEEYERIFKVPVVFNSTKNAVLFDEDFLSFKLPKSNQYVFGILCEKADTLLDELQNNQSVSGQVQQLLMPVIHKGIPDMQKVAAQLGITKQTLYRKLKAEDTSYEKLLDALRHKMALQYLDGKKVSVKETAYLLGFSDTSSFSRAFKRWTGGRPSQLDKV